MAAIPGLHQGDYPDVKAERLMGPEPTEYKRGQDEEFRTGVGRRNRFEQLPLSCCCSSVELKQ